MDKIDVNFLNHNRQQVLQKYTFTLRQLRNLAEQSYRVLPFSFDNYVLFQYFQQRNFLEQGNISQINCPPILTFLKIELLNYILDRRRRIFHWLLLLSVIFICIFAYRGKYHSSMSMGRTLYPGLRMWRKFTLPVIERFPRLTELYDESCLMENPFFQIEDLSCEPCMNVQKVLNLSPDEDSLTIYRKNLKEKDEINKFNLEIPSENVPFVFKLSNQNPIQLDDFYNIYVNNHKIFQRDAYRVQSTNRQITNLEELFNQFNQTQNSQSNRQMKQKQSPQIHNLWRCNRMLPARLLREIFVRPKIFPSSLALERYIAIDTPQATAYTLPNTECANVYVHQARGTRFIILRPTSECKNKCRTLSLQLPQSSVLSYNWWYWKPISAPDPVSDTMSISLIGSYC